MAYSAEVVSKELRDGKLRVTLKYSDGKSTHTETMETRCSQDLDWIAKEASNRCNELDELATFATKVSIGSIAKSVEPPVEKEPDNLYKSKLDLFLKAQYALRMGIITEETAAFADLKKWLTDNFLPEYLDLFLG